MARIKDSSIEAVKNGADFVAVVEERTSLRKAGGRLVGRCPFHEERTPSFSVNPVDRLYHCFGCGKGGDMITFVKETQGVDFVGAIEWLAERFRIPLEYEQTSPADEARRGARERQYALLEQAAAYYERCLWDSDDGAPAREYLESRSLGVEVCQAYRLGFAPGGASLTSKAKAKGFTTAELQAAGLTRKRGDDYFQRRLLFPLTDARGRVLGFQARRLFDDDGLPAKYVNTPESDLFHKGSVVYGLNLARADVSRENRACIVEGNTDVLALHQAGLKPIVACMGTALTEHQLRELGRLTKQLWLAFDGDAAGQSAALRGMELAVNQGFEVKVVALPPGVDPADDPAAFEGQLATANSYELHRTQVIVQSATDDTQAHRAVKEFLDARPDSPARAEAWRWATDKLGTINLRAGTPAARAAATSPRVVHVGDKLEQNALAGVLAHEELRPLLAELTPEHFRDPTNRALRDHLVEETPIDGDAVKLLAELDARAGAEGIDATTGNEALFRLREREVRRELQTAGPERTKELQKALAEIHEALAALGQQSA